MSNEHPQHDIPTPSQRQAPKEPLPRHPFTTALETWEAWSMANTMRTALVKAREQGDRKSLASFEEHPEWTQGPDPIAALAANREVVRFLSAWQLGAVREAREQGHGWREIGAALEVDPEQAKRDYLERVEQHRQVASRDNEIARLIDYDPRWRELADDNDADRADLERRALAYDDPGCPLEWPCDNGPGREAGHER
jgi:hypothetical protein